MPKQKTNKSIAKRIKRVTKGGKIIVRQTSAQHLATNKSKRRRKSSANPVGLRRCDKKRIEKVIYG